MPPSLLSRFDLLFVLTDKPEHERDLAIAEHIIKAHSVGELIAQHNREPIPGVDGEYITDTAKNRGAMSSRHCLERYSGLCGKAPADLNSII